MKVYALVGQSGTGKSFKAFMVARDREIEYIIDDGLLIGGTRVIAGKSAKREITKLSSVRRALFKDEVHRKAVKRELNMINPDRLLILGTSNKMVHHIAKVLELPAISDTILINHISTEEEIQLALKSRKEDGKHVIPVPALEIKKAFSGYFIDTLKTLSKRGKSTDVEEKTIIRPTFSYLGKYEISKSVISQMIAICVLRYERVNRILRTKVENNSDGVIINMDISIKLVSRIDKMVLEIQKKITDDIEYMTGLNVMCVNVTVRNIVK